MASELPPIRYAVIEMNGILVRPIAREVLAKAVKGRPIEINSEKPYINLHHVFERMRKRDRSLKSFVLTKRKIGQSRWYLFVTKNPDNIPEIALDPDYDPRFGRYRRLADRLAAGETLGLPDRKEASKVRRAWQLYVPRSERQHLRPVTAQLRSGEFTVQIVEA